MSNAGGDTLVLNGHEQTNGGGKFIETVDTEDPQYRRELQRPADVKEDMRQMESRQRVSSILNSQAFREELESIIADQLKHGPHPASLIALQQISELLLPNTNSSNRWHQISSMGKSGNVVIPINDVRGIDSLNYGKGERLTRCKFASLFRLIDLFGWSNGIQNCLSIRLNQEIDSFLINPYGLMYHEISASSLIKINLNADLVESGSTTYSYNRILFKLHSAVYKARPDIKCILHIHTSSANAISSLKCGLLPLTQEAILCGNVSYHEYKGVNSYNDDEEIKNLLAHDLGPINKLLFIRNYGLLAMGETIEEAWFYLINAISACETQIKSLNLAGGNLENLMLPNEETKKKFLDIYNLQLNEINTSENKKWKVGELEFEACMRCLDNAAYRTGYVYRQPVMRSIDRNAVKEVEIPPACSSFGYDPDYVKKLKDDKQKMIKGEWLNTPNAYAKTELEETGPFAKKVTKWIPENSPNKTSTPIRIEGKHQFAPQGKDPKELKNHQKQIKQDRFDDKKTPGHQSKILENITSENNSNINNDSNPTTDDQLDGGASNENLRTSSSNGHYVKDKPFGGSANGINHGSPTATYIYGAASKGIIKRDQQNNSTVYKSYQSTSNPFQQMDSNDLEQYKKEVETKQLKEQVQRKDDMHKELLDKSVTNDTSAELKKKSNTIPRSKSLLDKKSKEGGDSGASSSASSRQTSPKTKKKDKLNSSVGVVATNGDSSSINTPGNNTMPSANVNKSATLSTSSVKEVKPKKKSKLRSLSFLKSKKSKDQTQ